MKKGVIICTLLLFFGLCACGKSKALPASVSDSMELESGTENNVPDSEQIQLEGLRHHGGYCLITQLIMKWDPIGNMAQPIIQKNGRNLRKA